MQDSVTVSKTVVATGWSAVAFSLIASCAWFWFGTLEGFHEGWWAGTLSGNLWIMARYLRPGVSCADTPQNIWRLPTVEEIVASLTRHGKNAGGKWDPTTKRGTYRIVPDKESPLWRVSSKVIYWWCSSPAGNDAYHVVCFNGKSWPGKFPADSVGYRAVKALSAPSDQDETRPSRK